MAPETSCVPGPAWALWASASQRLERPGCSGVTLADCSRGAAAHTNAPFSLGLLWFTVSFLPRISVYFHLRRHSRDCRSLVAGMVYGLVTSVVLQTHSFTRSTEFAGSFS